MMSAFQCQSLMEVLTCPRDKMGGNSNTSAFLQRCLSLLIEAQKSHQKTVRYALKKGL